MIVAVWRLYIYYFPPMAEEQLLEYYNYLYPFDTLTRWLTYEHSSKLCHRELSFEMMGRDATYVERYVTFADADKMKERMIDRRSNVPLKVDAGTIWNNTPRKNGPSETVTMERELIFDFDMNDYDDVRTCCVGKTVCVKCWKLLVIAVEIMESALREDFGFTKFMYVFSGGRGLHIWVCDKRAREMKDIVRKGLVDYLELVHGNNKADSLLAENVVKETEEIKNLKYKLKRERDNYVSREDLTEAYYKYSCSSHTDRSLAVLRKHFLTIMQEQRSFEEEKSLEVMFRILGNRHEKLKENIKYQWIQARNKGEGDAGRMHEIMMKEVLRYEMSRTVMDYANGRQPDDRIHRLSMVEE